MNPIAPRRPGYFTRYLFRNHRSLTLIRRRFQRLLHPAGWVMLVCIVAIGTLGADTNASLGYQTFSLLMALFVLAAFCVPLSRPRIAIERVLPKFGSVGQRLHYQFRVRNLTGRRQTDIKLIDETPDPRPTLEQYCAPQTSPPGRPRWVERMFGVDRWRLLMARNQRGRTESTDLPPLAPWEDRTVGASLLPLRRGVLRLTGVTVACPEPIGVFRSLRKVSAPQSVLILPKRYAVPAFELPGVIKYQQGGVSLASSVGESEEFVALREYRAGDPMRHLHWKSFAKLGRPIVKEFQDEFFVRHALALDTFAPGGAEELFEAAVSVAASLAYAIQHQDSLLDLMFVGVDAYCFTSGRGLGRVEKMLEVLASVQLCQRREFQALEQLMLEHVRDISGCVCVFLAWDEPRQRLVRSLLGRGIPVRALVVTVDDTPLAPGPLAADPQNFHVIPAQKIAERLAAL